MAENVGFVKCFLKSVEKNSYRKLIGNFYFVYSAMEEEMERHRQHPILSKIYFQELNRQRTWNKTSATTMDPTGASKLLSPAGEVYVQRIREISPQPLNC